MATKAEFLVGLDIGTARVAAAVVERQGSDLNLIGVGTAPCHGVRRGVVANLDATSQAIEDALKEAELAAGVEIHSVIVGVAGEHIRSLNSHAAVAIDGREVRARDVERVLTRARGIELPEELDVLHVLPRSFTVGEQQGVRDPIGIVGDRLDAYVHVVTTSVSGARNVLRCCTRGGLQVEQMILTPLASAAAVLASDEEELGVGVIDLGAGTTDVMVFQGGALAHTAILPLGGHYVTSDVAAGLRTPFRDAELIKQRHGAVCLDDEAGGESIEVPAVGAREARLVPRRELVHIIEARVTEILKISRRHVDRGRKSEELGAGVVLTGGMASLPGIAALAETVLETPVRIGLPVGFASPSATQASLELPTLAAALGLTRFGVHPLVPYFDISPASERVGWSTWGERVLEWWQGSIFGKDRR